MMVRIDPVSAGYKGAGVMALYQQIREKLRNIRGVRNVTLANTNLFGGDSTDRISFDSPTPQRPEKPRANWTLVGPDYFATLGVPLLRGREIDAADAARGAQVCVVNEKFAKFFFPDSDPVGKHATDAYPTTRETYEIVGVVADAREHQLRGAERQRFYANIFHPIGTVEEVPFLLNVSREPGSAFSAVRHAISEVDQNIAVRRIQTLNEQIDRRLTTQRLMAQLSAFFGGAALLLAAIGLYGIMSYSISRRTSEIGIHIALRASQSGVIWMVLRETLSMAAIGVALGLLCALTSGREIASKLFGLTPTESPRRSLPSIEF